MLIIFDSFCKGKTDRFFCESDTIQPAESPARYENHVRNARKGELGLPTAAKKKITGCHSAGEHCVFKAFSPARSEVLILETVHCLLYMRHKTDVERVAFHIQKCVHCTIIGRALAHSIGLFYTCECKNVYL